MQHFDTLRESFDHGSVKGALEGGHRSDHTHHAGMRVFYRGFHRWFHTHEGHVWKGFAQAGKRRSAGRIARDHDQFAVLCDQRVRDGMAEAAYFLQGARPIRHVRIVAEIEQALRGERLSYCVEHREPTDTGIEDADGAGIHGRDRYWMPSLAFTKGMMSSPLSK